MSTWVAGHATMLYLLLAVAAVVMVGGWWMARNPSRRGQQPGSAPGRPYLFGLTGVIVLVALIWLVSRFTDTDAKQIERAIDAMGAGVQAGNADQIFAHISDSFHVGQHNKASFRHLVESHLRSGDVSEIKVWDFAVKELSREQRTAIVVFHFKVLSNQFDDPAGRGCKADFVLDPDDQWRLQTFKVVDPQTDPIRGDAVQIPGIQ